MSGHRVLEALPSSAAPPTLVLHVEDDPAHVALVAERLAEVAAGRLRVEAVGRLSEALTRLRTGGDVACVLLGLGPPDGGDLDALLALVSVEPNPPPVVVLTGSSDGDEVRRALRTGAEDWLPRGAADGHTLLRTIEHAIERHRTREQLAEHEAFVRGVLDAIDAHTAVLAPDGTIREVNSPWTRFAWANGGRAGTWGPGANYLEICDAAARTNSAEAADAAVAAAGIREILSGRSASFEMDYECSTPTREAWFTLRVTPLRGRVGGAVVSHVPITRLKQRTAELEHLALHDTVTGLPNRAGLLHALGRLEAVARRRVGLVVFVVAGLGLVNAGLGHRVGDEVLQAVAGRLRGLLPDRVTPARLDGDRFALLVADTTAEDLRTVARDLRATVDDPLALDRGDSVDVRLHIGTALADGQDATELLRNAETALHMALERPPGTIVTHDAELQRTVRTRLAQRRDLAVALRAGDLRCDTEPVVDADGVVVAHEALVRWTAPSGDPVPARQVVELAAELGALGQVLDAVLARALAERPGDEGVALVVNVDPRQLDDPRLAERVVRALEASGWAPGRLWLEVTGGVGGGPVSTQLEQLAAHGVRLCLGDVGAAPTALADLLDGPWDVLRVGPQIIAGVAVDEVRTSVLHTVLAVGRSLGATVGAVGVETERQRQALLDLGVELLQGRVVTGR